MEDFYGEVVHFYSDTISSMTTVRRKYKTLSEMFDPSDEEASKPEELESSIKAFMKGAEVDQTTLKRLSDRAEELKAEVCRLRDHTIDGEKESIYSPKTIVTGGLVGMVVTGAVVVVGPIAMTTTTVVGVGGLCCGASIAASVAGRALFYQQTGEDKFNHFVVALEFLKENLTEISGDLYKNPQHGSSPIEKQHLVEFYHERCQTIIERAGKVLDSAQINMKEL